MVGLSLVAVFAIAAITASSASALEWGKCEAKAGGNYTGPDCGKSEKAKPKGTGSYEWLKASQVAAKRVGEGKSKNIPFSGSSEGSGGVLKSILRTCEGEGGKVLQVTRKKCAEEGYEEFEAAGAVTIECAAEANTGEAEANNKVANIKVTFTGCTLFGVFPCHSAGGAEGEVNTNTLKGKLGWINKSAKEVGVVLEPAKHHGAFAEFECGGVNETVVGVGNSKAGTYFENSPGVEKNGGYDQIISPITPVNKNTSTFTQVYTVSSEFPFANLPSKFEGKHISQLEDYQSPTSKPTEHTQWEAAGEEITNVNTPEEEGEIKA